jgi:hypothetical protein
MHNCCSGYLNPFVATPDDIGSLVIIRRDGKELQPNIIEALFTLAVNSLELDGAKSPLLSDRVEVFTSEMSSCGLLGWRF